MLAEQRWVLVSWMIEVCSSFCLRRDTLFRAVDLLDRFLSNRQICSTRYQLLSATCLHIASKYEEEFAPVINDWCYVSCNSFTKATIKATEAEVLKALDWRLHSPTILDYFPQHRSDIVSARVCYAMLFVADQEPDYLEKLTFVIQLCRGNMRTRGWKMKILKYTSCEILHDALDCLTVAGIYQVGCPTSLQTRFADLMMRIRLGG